MQQHAQHVLGVEIVFMLDHSDELLQSMQTYDIPVVIERKVTSSAASSHFAAMLLPRAADLYVVFSDSNLGMFVRSPGYAGCFFLQKQWAQLSQVLPKDSVCRVTVYRNKADRLVLGVYDVLRLEGIDQLHLPVVERHKAVHQLFKKLSVTLDGVMPHWVGEEGCLLEHMRKPEFCNTLPFDIDNMLRIDNSETREVYKLVLRPLQL